MISWNTNGDLIGVTSKKNINIFDPRNEKFVIKQDIFERYNPPKLAWINNNLLISIVSDKGAKMLKLWDIRKQKDSSLNEGEINSIEISQFKSCIFTPFIYRELKVIYVIGKGKTNINLFNYNENKFAKINVYNISDTSICSVLFNRALLDKNKKEIDRFVICSKDNKNNQNIYYSSFYLPEESEISDSILYPVESKNILTYEQWIKGKNSTIFENNNNKEIVNKNDIKKIK